MNYCICRCGGTADALVSGSSEEIRVGSNPVTCTKQKDRVLVTLSFCFFGAGDEDANPLAHRAISGRRLRKQTLGKAHRALSFNFPSPALTKRALTLVTLSFCFFGAGMSDGSQFKFSSCRHQFEYFVLLYNLTYQMRESKSNRRFPCPCRFFPYVTALMAGSN